MRRALGLGLVVAVCSLLMAGSAFAIVGFGVKGGLNIANLKSLETVDTWEKVESESQTGFVGGAFVKFPFGPLRLQIEGLYSLKSSKGNVGSIDLSSKYYESKLTFLEIPVLLKYELPTPLLKPFVYGGASVAILMKAELLSGSEWIDIKDVLKSTDYGLVVGGGVELFGITAEVRYTHGLTNTVDGKSEQMLFDAAKNKTWAVMAGFDFF